MSGGIEQLVARGAQDVFLTGDPQVSFFRSAYKRYTNFSMCRSRGLIQGEPSAGGMSSVRFERKGDLLGHTYLVQKSAGVITPFNHNLVDHIELLVGGQIIDTQYTDYASNIYNAVQAKNYSDAYGPEDTFYPLRFFFCNSSTTAMPLVALQYHDVEIRIYWANNAAVDADNFEVWSNYTYLDTGEREYFASTPLNMLVKQVHRISPSSEQVQELNFNHPVSYIATDKLEAAGNQWGNPTNQTDGQQVKLTLKINGSDVGEPMEINPHYNAVPTKYHTAYSGKAGGGGAVTAPLFIIPFGIDLSSDQPTGSLNFSRLDSARLITSAGIFTAPLYAVNFNVLKIDNGMGGMMFAN